MSKREQPNKNKKPETKAQPFEKFRKQNPSNSPIQQAAGRAMKARVRSFNKANEEEPVERWVNENEPRSRKRVYVPKANDDVADDNMRLNKYLAHSGVASRRKADELIKAGKVTVNGLVVTEMGYRLQNSDKVSFDGKLLNPEPKVYLLLNKPKDFITTTSDERDRRTVMELISGAYEKIKAAKKPRLYPVGRLDRNTTGVLLFTNDGALAQQLMHPSTEIRKVYHVFLDKKLKESDFEKIVQGGVVLEDGIVEVDALAYPNPKDKGEVGIEIHSGKNRIVRRLFEALGYEVQKLDRVFFAGLTKKDLPRGRWRFLTEQEVIMLKHFTLGKKEKKGDDASKKPAAKSKSGAGKSATKPKAKTTATSKRSATKAPAGEKVRPATATKAAKPIAKKAPTASSKPKVKVDKGPKSKPSK